MHAVRSVLQVLFSVQQPMPCNDTTRLSMKDLVAEDLARYDFDHDCNYDSMATASYESGGNFSSVEASDEEPCHGDEEALAQSSKYTEHDTSTLPEKNATAVTLASSN